jgi:hypothetical protein
MTVNSTHSRLVFCRIGYPEPIATGVRKFGELSDNASSRKNGSLTRLNPLAEYFSKPLKHRS